jgi:hypothetical protein
MESVLAQLWYVQRSTQVVYNYMYEPPAGQAHYNCQYELRNVTVADARALVEEPSVHAEGFELWDAPSVVRDFRDDARVRTTYYAECAELAKTITGGNRAYIFDHLVRRREEGRPPLTFGRHGNGSQPAAAGRIHNDYTEASGLKRLAHVFPDPIEAGSVRQFCIVNIWRSIAGRILDTPLAVCEAGTVAAGDLVLSEIRYPTRTGEIYLLAHSPAHRWFYYSHVDRHEALVFKQYDSRVSGVARYTPHAAFDLPSIPPDAPLRESIEVRCLVTFD